MKLSGRLNRKRVRLHRLVWSVEQDVPVYANGKFVASRHFDCWLHIDVAPGNHCASLAHLSPNRAARHIADARICQGALRVR